MNSPIAISICLGLATTVVLIPLALQLRGCSVWTRRSTDWHHTHTSPIPRTGGLILVLAFIVVELWIALVHPELRARTSGRDLIVAASVAMFALGFWDDLRPLGPSRKLLGQVLISGLVCVGGVGIELWRTPFSQTPLPLGAWGPLLTIAWLVALTNLINLIDGIDGLAGGISLMLMGLIAAVAHHNGNFELLACGMAGALLGFLIFNFPPARIYLGDGGAYFLGFQIALYSIVNSHKGTVLAALVAPLFVLALPITDAALTIARRGLRGLPLFRPDRKHLHHRLVANGFSSRKLVLTIYGLNLVFLSMGLVAFWSRGSWVPILAGAAVLLLFVCAGSCGFSRPWFAVHRVVGSCWRMRGQVRYALSLVHWLELESRRRTGLNDFWPDLVFVADRLGFDSLKLTLPDASRSWQRSPRSATKIRRYQAPSRNYGRLELQAPLCHLGYAASLTGCRNPGSCAKRDSCLADERVFETISELLAEAWNNAAVQWHGRGLPAPVQKSTPQPCALLDHNEFAAAPFPLPSAVAKTAARLNKQ